MKKTILALCLAGLLATSGVAAATAGVHEDGVLNGFDLAIMKKSLLDGTADPAGDVDEDGLLTAADVSDMQDFLLGRVPCLSSQISAASQPLAGDPTAVDVTDTPVCDVFALSQMRFAVELFQNTAVSEGNTMVSPLSAMLALSMTANGAEGDTLAEMEQLLGNGMEQHIVDAGSCDYTMDDLNQHLKSYTEGLDSWEDCQLHLANSIWYRDTADLQVEEAFLNTNAAFYDAAVYRAAFDGQTVRDINLWVKKHTDGMIPTIIDELAPEAMMTLINAVSFDAKWMVPYMEEYQVYDGTFTTADGTKQTVPMMHSEEYVYYDFGDAVGFGKPYVSGYEFVAILPEEGLTAEEWIADMEAEAVWDELHDPYLTHVNAVLPKFSYDTDLDLKVPLQRMGMVSAFSPAFANFYGMGSYTGNGLEESLYIGNVIQKTHITVDSEGTRAAAATIVEMDCRAAAPTEVYEVVLNRPFVYMIVDTEHHLPIFMGTVQSTINNG